MKWLIRRRERKDNAGGDKVAKGIAGFIIKVQTSFAKFMNKMTGRLPASSLKILLAIFLLSGSALSIYFIMAAIINKEQSNVVQIDHLSVPRYYNKEAVDSMSLITEQEEVQTFKQYMNSLQQTKIGKILYDSIMLHYPGLMDSIDQLEKLYQSQVKNEVYEQSENVVPPGCGTQTKNVIGVTCTGDTINDTRLLGFGWRQRQCK